MKSRTYNAAFPSDATSHAVDLPCAGNFGTMNLDAAISMSSSILTSFPFPFPFMFFLSPKLAILTSMLITLIILCCDFFLPFCSPFVYTGSTSISIPAPVSLAFHSLHAGALLPSPPLAPMPAPLHPGSDFLVATVGLLGMSKSSMFR